MTLWVSMRRAENFSVVLLLDVVDPFVSKKCSPEEDYPLLFSSPLLVRAYQISKPEELEEISPERGQRVSFLERI